MARTNGPIQVWAREDTIPLDSEGGYAGGDSTAAAVGTSLDQSSKALGTVDNLAVTATTVEYGQPATATITGEVPSKVINLGIPKGMPGDVASAILADAQTAAQQSTASAADAAQAVTLAQQAQAAAYEVPDTAMSDIVNNTATETAQALRATLLPSTEVDVRDMPSWTGIGDQTAAFVEAAGSKTGAVTVRVPAGEWQVQGAPIREGVHYVGEGCGPTGTKLVLPSTPAAGVPMFVSTQRDILWSGGIYGMWLQGNGAGWGQGADAGVDGINIFTVPQTMGFFIKDSRIDGFDIGIRGAQDNSTSAPGDDRWLVIQGSLIWNNKIGLYGNEHPQVFGCDFRQNDIGISGRLHDFNLVGKNKIIRNRVGLSPDTIDGRGGMSSSLINGAIFFRNSTAAIIGVNTTVTGCLIEGGEWNPNTGSNFDGAALGIVVKGQNTGITNNFFNPMPNVEFAESISIQTPLNSFAVCNISGNSFQQYTAGKVGIRCATGNVRGVNITGNYFSLRGGSLGVQVDTGQTYDWTFSGNKALLQSDAVLFSCGTIVYGVIAGNSIMALGSGGTPWASPIIQCGSSANLPTRYESNSLVTSDTTASLLTIDGRYAIVLNNSVRSGSTIDFHTAADANAVIEGNVGTAVRSWNRGTIAIPGGSSSIVVTHGVTNSGIGFGVLLSAQGSEAVWFTDRTETTFTINRAGTSGTLVVAWQAYR